jgi:predicted aspartyl protease
MSTTPPRLLAIAFAVTTMDLASVAVAADLSSTPTAECVLKRYTSVSIDIANAGFVTLPVTLNGEQVRMALNSSSVWNSVGEALATRLKLPRQSLAQSTIQSGGRKVNAYVSTDSLLIGTANFGRVPLLVDQDPVYAGNVAHAQNIVGSIGLDLFSNVDVEIDFPGRLLTIYSSDHCPGRVVNWAQNYDAVSFEKDTTGQLYFPMELDGVKLQTALATGSGLSLLSSQASKRLFGFDEKSPEIIAENRTNGNANAYFHAMRLTAEGLAVLNTRVRLRPTLSDCSLVSSRNNTRPAYFDHCLNVYPLLLGMNVLSQLHIYIATKEKKLYFTAAGAMQSPPAATTNVDPPEAAPATQ